MRNPAAEGDTSVLDLVVRNARPVAADRPMVDLGIRNGTVVVVAESGVLPAARREVDAAGRFVVPGAVDTHTHVGEVPAGYDHRYGMTQAGNYATETRAALLGGTTTVLNYAKFGQGSLVEAVSTAMKLAELESRVHMLVHGYVMNDRQLEEVPKAALAGVRTFKIFMPYRGPEAVSLGGIGSLNHAQLSEAFRAIADVGGHAMVHAEDGDIVAHCTRIETARGMSDLASYDAARPVEAEGDASWTALYLASRAGCPVTIVHVSSPEGLRAFRAANYERATLETCPHYVVLSNRSPLGTLGKVAPPLRAEIVANAVSDAVVAGEIAFFGSDHNAWPSELKGSFVDGLAGLPGIGSLMPIVLTHLVGDQEMPLADAVRLLSTNAADTFGLPTKGRVAVGADADLVVLEKGEWAVPAREPESAVDYSPYAGMTVRWLPGVVIRGGDVVVEDGRLIDDESRGHLLNER